ncbi:MAG: sulfatase-like hydrolase/transferase, partial [Pseudomonadota bacterium]
MAKFLRTIPTSFIGCFLYLAFTVVTIYLLQNQVGWRRTHVVAHIVVLLLGLSLALFIKTWSPKRWSKALFLSLITPWIALHIFAVAGSLLSNSFIHQNISFDMLLSNGAIITDFLHPLLLILMVLLLLALSWLIADSLNCPFARLSTVAKTWGPIALLAILLAVITLRMSPLHFSQEPIANFFGYPGFDVLTGSFKERIEQEERLSAEYRPRRLEQRSNVILVMVDSLSPYHLPVFGYSRDTTPNLDRLLADTAHTSVYQARSTCSDSICGIVSTLTSRSFLDFASGRALKLGDVLRQQGYGVNLILASDHDYDPLLRFFFKDSADFRYDRNSTQTRLNSDDIILEGLRELPDFDGKPQFIYTFMFSTHQAGEKRPEFVRFEPTPDDDTAYRTQRSLSSSHSQAIRNVYDNRVLQWDRYFAETWEILEDKGYLDDAIIVIVGDHGEATGQHGYYGHG